jgi:hypothetical protein
MITPFIFSLRNLFKVNTAALFKASLTVVNGDINTAHTMQLIF